MIFQSQYRFFKTMKTFIALAFVLVVHTINAQEGYEGYGKGGKGYEGYGKGYEGYGKGEYGKGEYGGYDEKVVKPGAFKPPIIPYFKPVITYSKYPSHHGLIPIDKLPEYQPQFDLTKFIKPYEHAHLLQKHGKHEDIVKYAPPVYIKQPPITKTIYQHVYVKQPTIVEKIPVIHKSTEVVIKKKPPKVEFEKEVPIDIKDFGKTSVLKPKIPEEVPKEPFYGKPKEGGEGGGEIKPEYQ